MKVNVLEVIEKNIGISTDDGKKINDVIVKYIRDGNSVEVSFEGMGMIISHFLDESIGKLYKIFHKENWDMLDKFVSYSGLNSDDKELLLTKVIPTSKNHFSDEKNSERIQKDILNRYPIDRTEKK